MGIMSKNIGTYVGIDEIILSLSTKPQKEEGRLLILSKGKKLEGDYRVVRNAS
jgi:hypothetical protein